MAICLFSLFYFLYDGRGIFSFLLNLMPRAAQARADAAALRGWQSLSAYVRATVLVALVDALGVLIVALVLQVPLAPALAALVFLGAFIPLVGAFVSGFVAVLVGAGGGRSGAGADHARRHHRGDAGRGPHPAAVPARSGGAPAPVGGAARHRRWASWSPASSGALVAVPILAFVKTFVQELYRQSHEVVPPAPPTPPAAEPIPDTAAA